MSLFVASVSFPLGLGQFVAGELTTHEQVFALFSNFTWTDQNLTVQEEYKLSHWKTPWTGVLTNLVCCIVFNVSKTFFKYSYLK